MSRCELCETAHRLSKVPTTAESVDAREKRLADMLHDLFDLAKEHPAAQQAIQFAKEMADAFGVE
jgi:hypothetical protein